MLDALLDLLPPGSRWLDAEVRWSERAGPLFRRILNAPVALPAA